MSGKAHEEGLGLRREGSREGAIDIGLEAVVWALEPVWGLLLLGLLLVVVVLCLPNPASLQGHPHLSTAWPHLPVWLLIGFVWLALGWSWGLGLLGLWLVTLPALSFFHPVWAANHPRLAAIAWPYVPVFLVTGLVWLGLAVGLAVLTSRAWTELESHWSGLVGRAPALRSVGWLYLWLPLLLVYGLILVAAARFLSRRFFHAAFITLALCATAAVLLHEEPRHPQIPGVVKTSVACPFDPRICLALSSPQTARTPAQSAGEPHPPPTSGQWLEHLQRRPAQAWSEPLTVEAPLALLPEQLRSLAPSPAHHPPLIPGTLPLVALAVALLFVYRALRSLNSQHATLPIEVGPIIVPPGEPPAEATPSEATRRDVTSTEGRRRPELEQLIRETLQVNALHTAPRVPGGSLLYWRELLETQTNDRLGGFTRLISLLMRVAIPPHGLLITGVVVPVVRKGKAGEGFRFSVKNLRTHRVELAETYVNASLEAAVKQAAFATSELALELCPTLPEWTYWRERTGRAVQHYWKGVDAFRARPFHVEFFRDENLKQASEHFEAAAKLSHGNAMTRLQYGQVHEAKGDFARAARVYLHLSERSPHMVVARFRLALVCSFIDRWLRPHLEDSWQRNELKDLLHDLGASQAFLCFLRQVPKEFPDMAWKQRLGGWAEKLPETHDTEEQKALRTCLHAFAIQQLRSLERACFWNVMGWCLRNVAERRRLARTMMWPPQWLRATHHSMKAARCCTYLRECLLQEPARMEEVLRLAGDMSPTHGLQPSSKLGSDTPWTRRFWKYFRQARALELEADSAQRRRAHGWGMVHYNLACFHSLCLMPRIDPAFTGTAKSKKSEKGWRIDVPSHHCDVWSHHATRHLSHAMHDPLGPIAKGTWWWMEKDPDLRALRRHPHYDRWQKWVQMEAEGEEAPALKHSTGEGLGT